MCRRWAGAGTDLAYRHRLRPLLSSDGEPTSFFNARFGGERLSPRHKQFATAMTQQFYRLFPEATCRVVQMAFRTGYGPVPAGAFTPPDAPDSPRLELEVHKSDPPAARGFDREFNLPKGLP